MNRIRRGIPALLIVLAACGKGDTGLPAVTVLSPEGANHQNARFSPDGNQVAYWAAGATGWDLMVAGADLGSPRRVTGMQGVSQPVWSPDGSRLAFTADTWGSADVAVVPAGGGEVRRLTDSPGLEIAAGWHPDGDRVVYVQTAEGGTFRSSAVSLASGKSAPLLTETRPHFAYWSPDGTRTAYVLLETGKSTIWTADSAGGNARQLTTEGLEDLPFGGSPWSPDGSELLYVSRRTGTTDVWAIPVDGGTPRQLTRDLRDDREPVWSSDGKWVAFLSTRGQQTDVWVVPAAGGEASRVTDDVEAETGLQWVGRGSRLAFQTTATTSALWALNVADAAARQITPDSIRAGGFRPSPDGTQVVYEVIRGGGVTDLQIVSLADGSVRNLVAGTSENYGAEWSPDGATIVFTSNRSGAAEVWTVPAAGGEPHQLTDWPTEEYSPTWTPDGSGVYFISSRDAALGDVWVVPAAGGEPRRVTTVGNVNGITQSRTSPHLFLSLLGGRAGQFTLARLGEGGALHTLWDRSNVFGVSPDGLTAGGDSVIIGTDLPEGGQGNFLISTRTGQGRRILGKDEFGGDFSPDGTLLAYAVGSPNRDLAVLDMKGGSTRRLTNTPENETGYWWTSDGRTLIVNRRTVRSRIVTADLTRLLNQTGR